MDRIAGRYAESGRPDRQSRKASRSAWAPTVPRPRRCCPYYENHKKLVEVDGMGSVETVAAAIDEAPRRGASTALPGGIARPRRLFVIAATMGRDLGQPSGMSR